ncbi:MAG: nitroreductase family protein [Prevotella sp.]|nr:nitroreductase family protein [Prevotella sp.]
MKKEIIPILLLLASLLAGTQNAQAQRNDRKTADAVMNTILTRTSVRTYQDKPVGKALTEKLLRAGMAAPTAVNRQPWHFVVVDDKAVLAELAHISPNGSYAEGAPLAIIVCGDLGKSLPGTGADFWVQDCSAATENILLVAHALGLGAVWTAAYPTKERHEGISRVLRLPPTLMPLNMIIIGYPRLQETPKDKWNPANITYNRYGSSHDAGKASR